MRTLSCMIMTFFVLSLGVCAQNDAGPAGVKAFDIGKNGADKGVMSVRFPTAEGGYVLRTKEATGVVFFGERLVNGALALRIPIARLEGLDPKKDAAISTAVGLDAKKDPAILFESTAITAIKVKDQENTFRIRGKLTLRGITKDATFEGQIIELSMPGGREKGFVGETLNVQMAAILDPHDFGITVPEPEKGATSQQMNVRFNVFCMTNDKPSRNQKAAIEDVLYPKSPESRPAVPEKPADPKPDSAPTKKN